MGKPGKAELRSIDVLSDVTVPHFRAKVNMAPGLVTFGWFTPERTRNIDVFCEQLCGIAHSAVRGKAIVEALTAHDARLCNHPTFAQSSPHVPGDATAGEALVAACAACHGSQSKSNPALHAPK